MTNVFLPGTTKKSFVSYLYVPFFEMRALNCLKVISEPGRLVLYGMGSLQR